MDASKPVKWGICGVGKISQDFCSNLCSLPPEKHQVCVSYQLICVEENLVSASGEKCVELAYLYIDGLANQPLIGLVSTRDYPFVRLVCEIMELSV